MRQPGIEIPIGVGLLLGVMVGCGGATAERAEGEGTITCTPSAGCGEVAAAQAVAPPAEGFACEPPTDGSAATAPAEAASETYLELMRASCAQTVTRAVVQAGTEMEPEAYGTLFFDITGVDHSPACAFGVVGYLSTHAPPARPDQFVFQYLTALSTNAERVREHGGPAAQARLDNDIAYAIRTILTDSYAPSGSEPSMITALYTLRLDLRDAILRHVDYESPDAGSRLRAVHYHEYAACVCDAGAPARLAAALSGQSPSNVANYLDHLRNRQVRGTSCLSPELIRWLVEPYLSDERRTAEIDCEGPPVCTIARGVLEQL